jgi:hypothetical protein
MNETREINLNWLTIKLNQKRVIFYIHESWDNKTNAFSWVNKNKFL